MIERVFQAACLLLGVAVLGYMGLLAQRRVKRHQDMSVGGRTFKASDIFFSLYAFWGGNTIAGIVELAHRDGIASGWFGVSRMIMFLLILLITGGAFRRLGMITLSNFISQRFNSSFLRLLSATIIVVNFTAFTVSSVVGASAFFTAILDWPVWLSVLFTVFSFLLYTSLGGMYAIAFNGKILTIGQILALLVAAVAGVQMAGWENVLNLDPTFLDVLPKGYAGNVIMWLFTFVVNAFAAQAALQIVMSCKNVSEGRRGLLYVALGFIPIIILAPLAGLAAKALFPALKSIQAMPMLASNMPSIFLSASVVLGLFFTTLGWASSCILSGGTVAANDLFRHFVPHATSEQLIRVSRVCIVLLSLLTIGFALLIPSGVEFWTIVGFVLRNTGLFPLILIGLFWNAISKRAAIVAAIAGSGTGLAWYMVSYPAFPFQTHPMFVGMMVSIIVVSAGTVMEYRREISFALSATGITFGVLGVLCAGVTVVSASNLSEMNLLLVAISCVVSLLFVCFIFSFKRVDKDGVAVVIPFAMEEAESAAPERGPSWNVP
jgi:SSS family solute:Na+ symporter